MPVHSENDSAVLQANQTFLNESIAMHYSIAKTLKRLKD